MVDMEDMVDTVVDTVDTVVDTVDMVADTDMVDMVDTVATEMVDTVDMVATEVTDIRKVASSKDYGPTTVFLSSRFLRVSRPFAATTKRLDFSSVFVG
jgi:hypothetical protein